MSYIKILILLLVVVFSSNALAAPPPPSSCTFKVKIIEEKTKDNYLSEILEVDGCENDNYLVGKKILSIDKDNSKNANINLIDGIMEIKKELYCESPYSWVDGEMTLECSWDNRFISNKITFVDGSEILIDKIVSISSVPSNNDLVAEKNIDNDSNKSVDDNQNDDNLNKNKQSIEKKGILKSIWNWVIKIITS